MYKALDERDEASFAAGVIQNAVVQRNNYGDFAVLPHNAQSRVFRLLYEDGGSLQDYRRAQVL